MDIDLKVSTLDKLLDVLASGVGAVGAPILARWTARAKADALRIEAQGTADTMRLIADAQADAREKFDSAPVMLQGEVNVNSEIQARLSFQEEKRQRNIESIVRGTAEELGEKEVQDYEVDHDWVARFFANAQDVSSEKMQQIWSKILAGEVETPGRTSLQTLGILRNMTQKDAELFSNLAKFTIQNFILQDDSTKNVPGFPTFNELLYLESFNLIHMDADFCINLTKQNFYQFDDGDIMYSIFQNKDDENAIYTVMIPCYLLSPSGKELYSFIKSPKNTDYLRVLASFLKKNNNGRLEYASIIGREESGVRVNLPWTPVEPASQD